MSRELCQVPAGNANTEHALHHLTSIISLQRVENLWYPVFPPKYLDCGGGLRGAGSRCRRCRNARCLLAVLIDPGSGLGAATKHSPINTPIKNDSYRRWLGASQRAVRGRPVPHGRCYLRPYAGSQRISQHFVNFYHIARICLLTARQCVLKHAHMATLHAHAPMPAPI